MPWLYTSGSEVEHAAAVLVAYALLVPRQPVVLRSPLIPMPAHLLLVAGYAVFALLSGLSREALALRSSRTSTEWSVPSC
jgi:membrane associated rhomboid family serine protease